MEAWDCATRYPILLHGLNCRDDRPVAHWGRMPERLRREGF